MKNRSDLAAKRAEIREEIRAAAIAEFAENGLRGASTQSISARAGISKTKLHYYISSKEELYEEALTHIISIWSELFDGIPVDQGPKVFLSEYIRRKINFSIHHSAEVNMFVNEIMRGAQMLQVYWAGSREATQRAAAQIQVWIDEGLIRPVDPMLLQFHIWALTESYAVMEPEFRFMLKLDADIPLDIELINTEVTNLVLNGLGISSL